jgi:uncharacterized protein
MIENYRRPITLELKQRLCESPRRIIVIAGPRQVGKTTAVRQTLSDLEPNQYVFHAADSFDNEASITLPRYATQTVVTANPNSRSLLVDLWQRARTQASRWITSTNADTVKTRPFVLVIDEIQHIEEWSTIVKGLWDEDRSNDFPMHVVILGSAPLLMRHGLSESLMGRFETLRMTHWSFNEMQACFNFTLDQFIYFGGYPGPAKLVVQGEESRWRNEIEESLIEPNISRDVLSLAKVEKPALLRQLFELTCNYSGQIVAVNKLLGQLQGAGNTTTLSHYLELLSAAGLVTGIKKYSTQQIRQRAAPPKLNVLNSAFQSVYCQMTFEQARRDSSMWGRLVESAVGAHLANSATNQEQVYYWRESPFEVDFVLKRANNLCAIEVKSGTLKASATRGLAEFANRQGKGANTTAIIVGPNPLAIAVALSTPAAEWFSKSTFND